MLLKCLLVTDSQQRHEEELLRLQEKLQSLSDDHDDSCQSPEETTSDTNNLSANGEKHETDSYQAEDQSGQAKTSKQKLHDIINSELSVFCEKMCSSRTGDVSKEEETNQRHEVAEGYDENLRPEDDVEKESSELGADTSKVSHEHTSGNQDFIKEMDNLKRKLADDLLHFISSNEGKILTFKTTRNEVPGWKRWIVIRDNQCCR